ncbi:hypothetical protein ACFL4G_11395 [Thermodesulfobacteriota bacterium]
MIDRTCRIVPVEESTASGRTGGWTLSFTAAFLAVLVAVMPACTWKALTTGKIGADVYIDRMIFSGMERGTPVAIAIEAVRGSKDAFWMRKRADLSYRGWIWREGGVTPLISKNWTKRVDPKELICPHNEFILARSMEDRITFTLDNGDLEIHFTTDVFYEDFPADSKPWYGNAGVAAAELMLNGRKIKGYALSERIHEKTDMSLWGAPHRIEIEPRGTTVFLWEREGNTWLVRVLEDSGDEECAARHPGSVFHKDPFERVSQMKNAVVEEGDDGWVINADFGGWKAALSPVTAFPGTGSYHNVRGSLESDGTNWEVFGVLKAPSTESLPAVPTPGSED